MFVERPDKNAATRVESALAVELSLDRQISKPRPSHGPIWKIVEPIEHVFGGDKRSRDKRRLTNDGLPDKVHKPLASLSAMLSIASRLADVIPSLDDRSHRQNEYDALFQVLFKVGNDGVTLLISAGNRDDVGHDRRVENADRHVAAPVHCSSHLSEAARLSFGSWTSFK